MSARAAAGKDPASDGGAAGVSPGADVAAPREPGDVAEVPQPPQPPATLPPATLPPGEAAATGAPEALVVDGAAAWGEAPPVAEPEVARLVAPRIPGYKLHALIGRGATGLVYRATQLAVERQIALKVLHPELVPDRRAVLRLQREARLAARLAHPSIISAIDMGEVGGRWWYAMELVEGMSLLRRITARGPLSERECLRLFSPLCDALQHAHEVGVVHRDIKPANVLIDRRGRARLVDLGLAMSPDDPSVTRAGGTLGTPHYVSPEQARDPRQADTRSDLWSLGATMYHAVTGRPPFVGVSVAEILAHVLHHPVPDPRELAPGLSKGFALMLGKCLTRDPARRYQEPYELMADIELLRERRRPEVRAGAVDAFASRRPAWISPALVGLGLAGLVGGTWVAAARPWQEVGETTRAPRLDDWPELVRVRDGYAAGGLNIAAALAELEATSLNELPDEARFTKNGLVQEIKLALDALVAQLTVDLGGEVDRALLAHDFDGAQAFVTGTLPLRLRTETGFDATTSLPQGRTRLELEAWVRDNVARVDRERRAAVEQAGTALLSAYPSTIGAEVEAALDVRDWKSALGLLDATASARWLELAKDFVDLRGLDTRELRAVADRIAPLVSEDLRRVTREAQGARDGLIRFIESERERINEDLDVPREDQPGRRLREAYTRKLQGEGIERSRVPEEWMVAVERRLESAAAELDLALQARRDEIASAALPGLLARADALRAQRRYEDEADLWAQFLAEPWRRTTHDVMRLRRREAELVAELVRRAALGLEASVGAKVTLSFDDRIRREGEIEAALDVVAEGFDFKVRGQRLRVGLVRSADPSEPQLVLGVEDVLEFATRWQGEPAPGTPTALDSLAVAAFLLAEGRPTEARAILRLDTVAAVDGALAADLDDRIRMQLDDARLVRAERDTARETELATLRLTLQGPRPAASKLEELDTFLAKYGAELKSDTLAELEAARGEVSTQGSFEQVYGVPNLERVAKDVRLYFDFGVPEGRGAWRLGQWTATSEGLTLASELVDDLRFHADDTGAQLALLPPLDTRRPLRVALTLRPDSAPPRGQLVAVTIAGYHLLLRDGRGPARAWFGTGDLRALVDKVVKGGDDVQEAEFSSAPFPGLVKGRVTNIDIRLRPRNGALDKVEIDGRELGFSKQFKAPVSPPSYLYVRSREAATMVTLELQGQRRAN